MLHYKWYYTNITSSNPIISSNPNPLRSHRWPPSLRQTSSRGLVSPGGWTSRRGRVQKGPANSVVFGWGKWMKVMDVQPKMHRNIRHPQKYIYIYTVYILYSNYTWTIVTIENDSNWVYIILKSWMYSQKCTEIPTWPKCLPGVMGWECTWILNSIT